MYNIPSNRSEISRWHNLECCTEIPEFSWFTIGLKVFFISPVLIVLLVFEGDVVVGLVSDILGGNEKLVDGEFLLNAIFIRDVFGMVVVPPEPSPEPENSSG